jgi:hypothetical protein
MLHDIKQPCCSDYVFEEREICGYVTRVPANLAAAGDFGLVVWVAKIAFNKFVNN